MRRLKDTLLLSDFDYTLPKELIAQYPLIGRQDARLLVLDRNKKTIEHKFFHEVVDYFKKDDLLALNDTKVLPSRLLGRRVTGGKVEALLLKRKNGLTFEALLKPGRLKIGEKVSFSGGKISGVITARNEVHFQARDLKSVYRCGVMPLPPYIKRASVALDNDYYQTVYAKKEGAVAAPTAGLHFTKELLAKIQVKGVNLAYLTLHVGIGTFKPVKSLNIKEHKIEAEDFRVPALAAKLIKQTKAHKKGRIIAVGTTSCRALETFARGKARGRTGIFIYPGHKFKLVDCLLTNFHLPRTTLFMLVSAFAGEKLIKQAYAEAIAKKYRFYSYGDAMLIL